MNLFGLLLQDAFWSAIAATGFAILFNVPPRLLVGCAICGATGHMVRTLIVHQFHTSLIFATFMGAVMVGLLAHQFARRHSSPTPIFAVSGVIPMVPGAFAYRAMLGIFEMVSVEPAEATPILVETTLNIIMVTSILIALASGMILPQLLFDRRKPVV